MPEIIVRSMAEHPEWIEPCAVWWHGQWGEDMGYSIEAARAAITGLSAPGGGQAALIGLLDGVPAGSVFLIDKDLETHTHLSPWLAGLFVLPEFRNIGLGGRLTGAAIEQAAVQGHAALYLYTTIGNFYRRQGWTTLEKIELHNVRHEVMAYEF